MASECVERSVGFPELSSLSYGRANPVTFDARKFLPQQRTVASLVDRCLSRLAIPGLVTTTVEEVVWVAEWCHRRRIRYRIPTGGPLRRLPSAILLPDSDRMKSRSVVADNHGALGLDPESRARLVGSKEILAGIPDVVLCRFSDPSEFLLRHGAFDLGR